MSDLGRRKNIELRMFVYVSASQKFSFCSYHDHHNYDDDHHNYDDDDDDDEDSSPLMRRMRITRTSCG